METSGTPEGGTPSVTPARGHACARCGGLLLIRHYIDLLDDTGQIDITAWHCALCGEVIDPVILRNRRSPPPNLLYGTKERKFSQRVTKRSSEGGTVGQADEKANGVAGPDGDDEGGVDEDP
ncbi:MAG: hypothetical protein UZ03_NOB001001029 [Nitrospira sp. OLB3]|nr:MAG: hypothetical protein UZ03_NOB001001029 [Nitrospira sp. OLB3]